MISPHPLGEFGPMDRDPAEEAYGIMRITLSSLGKYLEVVE